MTFGGRLAALRRGCNMTQENFADRLGVSRQSVSKWESDLAYPETDKLIVIAGLFGVTVDYLLKGEAPAKPETESDTRCCKPACFAVRSHYEYKSSRTLFGLPLVHVNFGLGNYRAKGIVAIGNTAFGLLSFGFAAFGGLSFGLFSLGLLALGVLCAGLVSGGVFALGVVAAGAIAVGFMSFGAISVGFFSVGALAIGKYAALGDRAFAAVALGMSYAEGSAYAAFSGVPNTLSFDGALARQALDAVVPPFFAPLSAFFQLFL